MAGDGLEKFTEVPVEFLKDGTAFVQKCTKPDKKEYIKIIRAVGVGFIMMGLVGYAIKLIKHKTKDSESSVSQTYNYNPTGTKRTSSSASSTPNPQPRPNQTNSFRRSQSSEPPRTIDPAVQRLKELRRLENAKKEASNPKPKTQRRRNRSPSSSTSRQPVVRRRRTPEVQIKESALHKPTRSTSPQKRLSFKELMNQADEKARLLKERKEQSPNPASSSNSSSAPRHISKTQPRPTRPSQNSQPQSSAYSNIRRSVTLTSNQRPHQSSNVPRQKSAPPPPRPKPQPKQFAKPSAQLQAKLDAKRKEKSLKRQTRDSYYDDEYESDFIEDDEELEEEEDLGYDRDEIWKMFNRGKSRSEYMDYDDDLSDMEATGSEVLNEEMRSAKRARLEEKEEAEREKRRVEEKRRRLGK